MCTQNTSTNVTIRLCTCVPCTAKFNDTKSRLTRLFSICFYIFDGPDDEEEERIKKERKKESNANTVTISGVGVLSSKALKIVFVCTDIFVTMHVSKQTYAGVSTTVHVHVHTIQVTVKDARSNGKRQADIWLS